MSRKARGAVYFDSTGRFDVLNDVMIEDNTTPSGAKANVYLAEGRTITVTGDLNTSRIGVTTARQPDASPGGISTQAGQEIKIAVLCREAVWIQLQVPLRTILCGSGKNGRYRGICDGGH